ncbi:TFIIH subunit Tfb1/GTF2H1 [Gracilaria domingensis]|nr:TFIIH subunit Tfb1/GTF2H1 [Gracilaria domingensis]
MADFEIERRCSFEKRPGIVQLSATNLVWTPDSAADGREQRVPFTAISQFQVSKEGSAKKAMIRLTCSDRPTKITLDFGASFTDRDAVRDVLNRLQSAPAFAPPVVQQPPKKPLSDKQKLWRTSLLRKKEVRQMHQRLVLTRAVTEETFWKGMKFRYTPKGELKNPNEPLEHADALNDAGVPSDAFTATNSCDDLKWDTIPSPAQRHQIFLAHPALKRAFLHKNVGFDDEKMWAMFAASSMAPRSARLRSKSDSVRAGAADAFFAPFQAREAERAMKDRDKSVHNLDATLAIDRFDDHRTEHIQDPHPPKRARVSDALRLMRMVNTHGAMIVGDGWKDSDERPLEDLVDEPEKSFAPLAVRENAPKIQTAAVDSYAAVAFSDAMRLWRADVARFSEPIASSGDVLQKLIESMRP